VKIEYLQKLEENNHIDGDPTVGVSLEEMSNVEKDLGNEFQTSLKECLYLAGEVPSGLILFPGRCSLNSINVSRRGR